jgi:hypothetical protein
MSELSDQHWAVISERGVESSGLKYEEARQLLRRLEGEKVFGLCIVTAQAAAREARTPVQTIKGDKLS